MALDRFGGGKPPPTPPRRGSSSSDEEDGKRKPLGVPDDYRVRVPAMGGPRSAGGGALYGREREVYGVGQPGRVERGPRYYEGDQFRPSGAAPDRLVQLQKAMWAAGLYSGTIDNLGTWSGNTIDAFEKLLGYANQRGITHDQALSELQRGASVGGMGGGSGSGGSSGGGFAFDENGNPIDVGAIQETFTPPPLQLKLPNRDDLRKVFRQSIIDTIGEGWSQADIDRAVDAYVGESTRIQKDAYGQEVDRMEDEFYGRPGASEQITTVDMPSPEPFLETEARKKDPVGYQAGELVNEVVPNFFQMMQGWV